MSSFHQDQAAGLRRIMAEPKPRIVSIISAATTQNQPRLLSNLAASLKLNGSDVLIVHAAKESNEAIANYQMRAMPTLLDVILRTAHVHEAIRSNPQGFSITRLLPNDKVEEPLDSATSAPLTRLFEQLAAHHEVVLVDATLNKNHLLPLSVLDHHELVIQLTRDPESIKQAYTLIKQICAQIGRRPFGIIVDGATEAQASVVYRNIAQVARRFMQVDLEFLGAIPSDEHVVRAAQLGRAVTDAFPTAQASTAFQSIAKQLGYQHLITPAHKQASYV